MVMKKGKQFYKVILDGERVSAIDQDNSEIKLTRSQRMILGKYKDPNYILNIKKEWHNDHAIHSEFTVEKNGKLVYTYTK
jgi:hypothetical protein